VVGVMDAGGSVAWEVAMARRGDLIGWTVCNISPWWSSSVVIEQAREAFSAAKSMTTLGLCVHGKCMRGEERSGGCTRAAEPTCRRKKKTLLWDGGNAVFRWIYIVWCKKA
jgi:hypothetical protein